MDEPTRPSRFIFLHPLSFRLHPFGKPCLGVGPFLSGLIHRDAKGGGDFFVTQAGKVAQLDHPCGNGIFRREVRQRFVQDQQPVIGRRSGRIDQLDPFPSASTFQAMFAPRVFDQDATHGLRRRSEKVAPAVPCFLPSPLWDLGLGVRGASNQAQISFMHEGRCLERLARLLLRQPLGGQTTQLGVDQGQKLTGRCRIPMLDCVQKVGNIVHEGPE